MSALERPRFIQIATGKSDYGWQLFALDEKGDVWSYVNNKGWQKETMKRLNDSSTTA